MLFFCFVLALLLLSSMPLWLNLLEETATESSLQAEGVVIPSPPAVVVYEGSLPHRLAQAVYVTVHLKHSGSYIELICPSKQQIGAPRPHFHPKEAIGTRCEAWANREWMTVVWELLDRTMIGLEWSTGSGTLWTLRRGVTLHTVEHCDSWLQDVERTISDTDFRENWHPHHIATTHGCQQQIADDWNLMERVFGNYTRFPRLELQAKFAPKGFDVINVDGRFRDGCILEALKPNMLKQNYGILMLDNAERKHFRKPSEIPSHWLVVSFGSGITETALWMACPSVNDANCERARREIQALMQKVPRSVGIRYKQHMQRAKEDGVPGA